MIVTQHTCHSAFYRLLKKLNIVDTGDQIELRRLDQEWKQSCGLRLADLHRSITDLSLKGLLIRRESDDATKLIQLTEQGSLAVKRNAQFLGDFRWSSPAHSFFEMLNTASTLRRARRRYRIKKATATGVEARAEERRKTA